MYTHVGMYNIYDNFDKTALYFTRATMLSTGSSFHMKIGKDLLNYNNDSADGSTSEDIII